MSQPWPAGLPPVGPEAYREAPPDNTIRTKMDAGRPKIRRRFTAGIRPISVSMHMTSVQIEILDAYYVSTLKDGSIEFEWIHPRTGAAIIGQFVGPPVYVPDGTEWTVSFSFEVLP